MKHFKILCVFALVALISCSQEEQSTTEFSKTANQKTGLTKSEVADLRTNFASIVTTTAWNNQVLAARDFNKKMKVAITGFETRDEFRIWLQSNLKLTNFSSTDEALNSFDNLTAKIDLVKNDNLGFYNSITPATLDQLITIFEPMTPPLTTSQATPCQNACMDACDVTLNNMEAGYAMGLNLVQQGDLSLSVLTASYWWTYDYAVDNLNSCMNAC